MAEDISMEELAQSNHVILNMVIDILVEKGVMSEKELQDKLKRFEAEMNDKAK